MNINSVINCTLIIRSQAEYSVATETVILRCMLEKSATGQRHGFTDIEALLTAVRAELMELQIQIVPSDREDLANPAEIGSTSSGFDSTSLIKNTQPIETGWPCDPEDTTS